MQPKFPQPMTVRVPAAVPPHLRGAGGPSDGGANLDSMALGESTTRSAEGFTATPRTPSAGASLSRRCCTTTRCWSGCTCTPFQVTGKPLYRRVVEDTLEYVRRRCWTPPGASTPPRTRTARASRASSSSGGRRRSARYWGAGTARPSTSYYGVTLHGNFEGHTILSVSDNPLHEEALAPRVRSATPCFGAPRLSCWRPGSRRVSPARDDKILTAWNGMMLRAFAEAGAVLDRPTTPR